MIVAEIKEYIDGVLKETENIELPLADIDFLRGSLKHTKSMLDELEPNNISQAIKIIDKEKDKLKFDTDKHQVDSCIFEIKNILGLGAKENNK